MYKSVCARVRVRRGREREREREKRRKRRERERDFIVMHRTTCPLFGKKKRESAAMLCRGYSVALIGSISLSPNGVFAGPPLHPKGTGNTSDCLRDVRDLQ